MTPKLAAYIEQGKALSAEDRLEAARQLLLSIDQVSDVDQQEIDGAWNETVERRVHEVVTGKANLVDGRSAHEQVRAEVAALRE